MVDLRNASEVSETVEVMTRRKCLDKYLGMDPNKLMGKNDIAQLKSPFNAVIMLD